jgi:Mg/Co/Ni transporter MgtE
VARTNLEDATELTVADVLHKQFTALPAQATVADVRAWFAASPHRRMAFLVDGERYAGSLVREDLPGDVDANVPALTRAHLGPTVAPEASARAAYQLALQTEARRVPAVDASGRLLGVVAVTADDLGFCGTS